MSPLIHLWDAAIFPEPFRLSVRESVGSTNDEVHKLAAAGAADGHVLLAEHQSAGRGRRGAAWYSPGGQSLAFSILVRPNEPKALWPRLALAAGLAVAEAIEAFGLNAGIKWPNDVWLSGRKVAGILVEAGVDYAVVGMGLNVNSITFPPAVSKLATSLQMESGVEFPLPDVLGMIIGRFAIRRAQIGVDFGTVIREIGDRCVLNGKHVTLTTALGPKTGVVEGIAPGGELLLRTPDGLERLVQADEVRLANG